MSADFVIKRHDTRESIAATLKDATGAAVNLSGASVRFLMRSVRGGPATVDAAAVIVSPSTGQVRYDWAAGDTDTAGDYLGEFEVTQTDGKRLTFPSGTYLRIAVLEDLG